MEELSPVLSWALGRHKELGLAVTEVTSIPEWLTEYSEYRVDLDWHGFKTNGRGAAASAHRALEVAFTEAYERAVVCERRLPSTNGVAAHPDLERAKEHARAELVERDLFLCHYLCQVPLAPLPGPGPLQDTLEKLGVRLAVSRTRPAEGLTVSVATADGTRVPDKPFGAVIGLGADKDPCRSAEKAVMECLPDVIAFLEGSGPPPISAAEFAALAEPRPEDHIRWSASPDSLAGIKPLLGAGGRQAPERGEVHDGFEYRALASPEGGPDAPPLHVVQCVNPGLHDLFFGITTPEKVDLDRLSAFAGRELAFRDLNPHPHPLA